MCLRLDVIKKVGRKIEMQNLDSFLKGKKMNMKQKKKNPLFGATGLSF